MSPPQSLPVHLLLFLVSLFMSLHRLPVWQQLRHTTGNKMIPSALSPPDLICHCQRGQHAIRETLPLNEGLFTEKPRLYTDDRFCAKWSSQLWRHVQWLVSMSPVTCHSFHSNLLYLKVKYCYYVIILWVTVWLYVIVNMEWEPSLSCELILCHSHTVRAVTHQDDISHICVFQKDHTWFQISGLVRSIKT